MSRWRLRGYVQDSDEEEEDADADTEALSTNSSGPSRYAQEERVGPAHSSSIPREDIERPPTRNSRTFHDAESARDASAEPVHREEEDRSLRLTTPSIASIPDVPRDQTESPDPLHLSPTLEISNTIKPLRPSHILGTSHPFNLELLSNFSQSDDALSDPPSDGELNAALASPRRHIEVQVVIPQSTAIARHSVAQRANRSLRTRKPIQLHPYLLEGERYRREFQSRGIKPVPKLRSPPRKTSHDVTETQEQEFDPENDSPSNSPLEISVSTPVVRRPRTDGPHGSSASRLVSRFARRDSQPAESHISTGTKRRKLNRPLTQASNVLARTPGRNNDSTNLVPNPRTSKNDELWAVPRSPPYSSSPPVNGNSSAVPRLTMHSVTALLPNLLPTPSNSSSVQDDVQPIAGPDPDPDIESAHRPGRQLFRPVLIPSDSSSSGSTSSDSESEQSETEVQRVGKRIKGVLPASWLRLDRQAQEQRKAQARERMNPVRSPEKVEPQRGVAQRITSRIRGPRASSSSGNRSNELIVISDESDNEPRVSLHQNTDGLRESVQNASELAAIFDRRYVNDDSEDMENDTLDLFPVGGAPRKRKRQMKLTDAFRKSKKAKLPENDPKVSEPLRRSHVSGSRRQRHGGSKRPRTPPALSILDIDQSPPERDRAVPQFIRLAKRQARRGLNHGRQSPSNKHIRLHTALDTEDANLTLQQWRKGVLKPNVSLGQSRTQHEERTPLSDRIDNQQHAVAGLDAFPERRPQPKNTQRQQNLPTELLVFRRDHVPTRLVQTTAQPSPLKRKFLQHVHRKSSSFRTAQLEGLESEFGRSHRQIAFERGLQRVDQQFNLNHSQMSRNPQIARFLTDDGSVLPPVPSAEDIGEQQDTSTIKKWPAPKRRRIRKVQAQRVDVDAREYRQPSEPTLQDLFQDVHIEEPAEQEQLALQGLGPFGTRYPTTFDVSPLVVGTYFQSSTFVGSEELHQALQIGKEGKRDLEVFAGHSDIHHNSETVKCGPWNDETHSRIAGLINSIWLRLDGQTMDNSDLSTTIRNALSDSSNISRSLIKYVSTSLSFLDAIDRRDFTIKMERLLNSLLNKVLQVHHMHNSDGNLEPQGNHQSIRTMTYLLVLSMQVYMVAQHSVVEASTRNELTQMITSISKIIITYLIRKGVSELGIFLEKNRRYKERENGIHDDQILVESLVVSMHVLDNTNITGSKFWDLVSDVLSPQVENATQLKTFESVWASVLTLLPFIEIDTFGILIVNRRSCFENDNWAFIRNLLKRLFILYPDTFKKHSTSLNEYIRASLTRCYVLIQYWHWRRCDPMLSAVFDYCGKNGLRQLRREGSKGSPRFLGCLAEQPSLDLDPSDSFFHIFLKCLALGLSGMKDVYAEKKIRSIVFRCTPNHGRSYPKDQPLDQESLDALRNHHDLLCTLYWASPPSCRPKLDLVRGLVQHETSHREACRLNVRAWANLTTFQLSSDEPYTSLQPFALWHKEIMQQTLKQYRLAKTEAEDYLKNAKSDGTSDISAAMVRGMMDKNQEQVIATLRDCIAGMRKAIKHSEGLALVKNFLIDSGIVQLLELAHLDDPRLTIVIRETLAILRDYGSIQKRLPIQDVSQPTSEESQDYGDFPDLDDLEDVHQQSLKRPSEQSSLEFIQAPLWHLLSNAFGAERAPDDNLLMECIDTWVLIAECQVSSAEKSWSYYIDSFSQVSWNQLRHTEQTRKFSPYFMASLITCDPVAYEEHRHEFLTALLLCLVDRESMLRFQHRFLYAVVRVDSSHPLLRNLPFFRDETSITADNLRTRRLELISSLLANMRADFHSMMLEDPGRVVETKRVYSAMLNEFMVAMKSNYQQLRQGTTVTGAYVEFVQKIVQSLKQYTSDICAVSPFFTDSVAFPLPTTDPTYVVGRLCGYAPKLADPGVAKQLSTFVQTVAQQAASDNQQLYLVDQLSSALCNAGSPSTDVSTLRSVLLQGIFPAYIEAAFSYAVGMVIAKPILQSLKLILKSMFFDLRVKDPSSVRSIYDVVSSVAHTFIGSTETLKRKPELLRQSHVLNAVALMLEAMIPILYVLDYINGRTSTSSVKPAIVTCFEQFNIFVAEIIHSRLPHTTQMFTSRNASYSPYADLLSFSAKDLEASIKTNWSENQGRIFFGQGHARREVDIGIRTMEEDRARVVIAIEAFYGAVACVYGGEDEGEGGGRSFVGDVFV